MLPTARTPSSWGPGTVLLVFGLWQLSIILAVGVTWRIAREAPPDTAPVQVVVNGSEARTGQPEEAAAPRTRLGPDRSLHTAESQEVQRRLLRERDEVSNAFLRLAFADLLRRAAAQGRGTDAMRLPELDLMGRRTGNPAAHGLRARLDQRRHGDAWPLQGALAEGGVFPVEDLLALDAWLGDLRANFTADDLLRDTEAFDALQGNLDFMRARLADLQSVRSRFEGGLDNVDDALDALRGLTAGDVGARLQGLLPQGADLGDPERRRALLTFILMQRMGVPGEALP